MRDSIKSNGECQSQATGVIYKLTNTLNGKAYVGKTKRSLNRRIYEHKRDGIKGKLGIGRAIQKYGLENFTAEVIEACPVDKLNEREMFWIRELGTKAPNGYNLTDGGDGFNPSNETRAKISAHHADFSGKKNPNYGKPRSAETIAKIIAHRPDMSGEKNPHYGKRHSPEIRAIISAKNSGENHPFYGKHLPPETCAKISTFCTHER